MTLSAKKPKAKRCRNPECGQSFTPQRIGQAVCGYACGLAIKDVNIEKAKKALARHERESARDQRERVKPKGAHAREAQAAFNEWVRLRDDRLPCVSCGRHHEGQYHAGHYRTVGSNPELRFEPLNVWKQCAPCNNHLSGNIVNYRIELLRRIGQEKLEWLEGPHAPKRYTIAAFKEIKAEYREKIKQLKGERNG